MRGVSRPTQKLPSSDQPPNVMLSKELVSPTDVRFVSNQMVLIVCGQLALLLYVAFILQGTPLGILCHNNSYCMYPQRRSDMRARITTSSVHLAWTLSRDRNDINALNL